MEIIANTADELFTATFKELTKHPIDDEYMQYEIVNANLVLTDPTRNTMCECIRKMPIRYAIGELLWYRSKQNTCDSIAPFSKFWQTVSDDGVTVNSNYGYCIHKKYDFDQWEMVKKLLIKQPNTRHAVLHIKEARNLIESPTKDVNCTIALQFLLRNGKLDMITTMRSNDIHLGLPYDVFNFTCMQIQMAMELGVEIGTYYHNAASLHMYRRDVNKYDSFIRRSRRSR